MKRFVLFALALTLILATVAACAPAPTPTPVPPPKPTDTPKPPEPTKPPTAPPPPAAKCDKLPGALSPKAGELGAPDKPIVITFVPSVDTALITKGGTAMADCLSKMTGLSFKVEVGTSEGASIEAMGGGKAQMGFLNTFAILLAKQKYGIRGRDLAAHAAVVVPFTAQTRMSGVDIDENVYPQEAGLEGAFALDKGCYIGQEVVAKIDTYGGLNKRLLVLRVDHSDPVARGTRLMREDEGERRELGLVTSWAYSFALDGGLVLAYVKRRHQEPGTVFDLADERGQARGRATIVPAPA